MSPRQQRPAIGRCAMSLADERVDPQLKEAMDESLRLYAEGDERFYDFVSDDVRVYSLDSVEPSLSRDSFRKAFAPTFSVKRDVRVLNMDVQAKGDQAVLAQALEISIDQIAVFVRQTVIWERGGERGWQMSHIHNALAGRPISTSGQLPQTAAEVQVLNERIATVAAAVGVAQ